MSENKLEAAGDMIARIYVDRQTRYKMEYDSPAMFPPAPQQTFVDAFSEEDTSQLSLKQRDQQVQYDAEVDLFRALESLEAEGKIIVLHSFDFSKEQAQLFSMSEESSKNQGEGEQDFIVIVRDQAIVLFEVKSPIRISNNNFKKNVIESRKQLDRAYELVSNIYNKFGGLTSDLTILQFTVFPKTSKVDLTSFPSYKAYLAKKMGNIKVLFLEDIQNFSNWWSDNVMAGLVEPKISSGDRTIMQRLEASLIGLWCIDKKNSCNIDICSLGYCIKQVDKAIKSEHITHRKYLKKPVSKSVEVSPDVFKTFLGIDCLTDEQLQIFEENKISQFVMGPAGSGKTILLFGKIIQLFRGSSNNKDGKKKFLLLTGTMDLAAVEQVFSKVGMRVMVSHSVYGGHRSRYGKLKLQKNELFFDAFNNNDAAFDIFVLHHESLREPHFWPENFFSDTTKEHFFSVINHKEYHTFIDDMHNFLDKRLAYRIDNDPVYEYDKGFCHGLIRGLFHEMNKRTGAESLLDSYFWLVYDQSQMTVSFMLKHESSEKYARRRELLFLYDRDLRKALDDKLEKNNDLFRSLSRDLRNTVDITLSIENVYMHSANHFAGPKLKKSLKIPKLYKGPGHHINGPKPVCVFVKNSDFQEHLVHKVILDELEKLLLLGDHLCPADVAIIYDTHTPLANFGSEEDPCPLPMKMAMKLQGKLAEVTIRMITDRDCIQASEWKAVIYVADLMENLNRKGSLPQSGKKPDVIRSCVSFQLSSMYVTLSRARVYLVVIGKLGGRERVEVSNVIARKWKTLSKYGTGPTSFLRYLADAWKTDPGRHQGKIVEPTFDKGEHVFLKKSDFLQRVVDNSTHLPDYKIIDSSLLHSQERAIEGEGIWFRPEHTVKFSERPDATE